MFNNINFNQFIEINNNYFSVNEFIDLVENLNTWDQLEPHVYRTALETVGFDYNSYDDPDVMFNDFKEKVEFLQNNQK